MNQKHASFRLLTVIIFCLITLSTLTMCNQKKAGSAITPEMAGTFSMKPIILDSTTLDYWVSQGWTKGKIKVMIIQFMTASGPNVNNTLSGIGFPAKSVAGAGSLGRFFLKSDTLGSAVVFNDSVIIANNCFDITQANIFNPDGSLKNFRYIKFTPYKDSLNYIVFKSETYNKDGLVSASLLTNPCPPCQYCPGGCPPIVED